MVERFNAIERFDAIELIRDAWSDPIDEKWSFFAKRKKISAWCHRVMAVIPDGVMAVPDGVMAVLPDGVMAVLPDGVMAVLPDGDMAVPDGVMAVIPAPHDAPASRRKSAIRRYGSMNQLSNARRLSRSLWSGSITMTPPLSKNCATIGRSFSSDSNTAR